MEWSWSGEESRVENRCDCFFDLVRCEHHRKIRRNPVFYRKRKASYAAAVPPKLAKWMEEEKSLSFDRSRKNRPIRVEAPRKDDETSAAAAAAYNLPCMTVTNEEDEYRNDVEPQLECVTLTWPAEHDHGEIGMCYDPDKCQYCYGALRCSIAAGTTPNWLCRHTPVGPPVACLDPRYCRCCYLKYCLVNFGKDLYGSNNSIAEFPFLGEL